MSKHVVHLADFHYSISFYFCLPKNFGNISPSFLHPLAPELEKSCIMKENHLRVLGMLIGTSKGLPGEFLLLFAVPHLGTVFPDLSGRTGKTN